MEQIVRTCIPTSQQEDTYTMKLKSIDNRKSKFWPWLSLFYGILAFSGCQKKDNECSTQEVVFDLEIDLSAVLDHESTNQTTPDCL